MVTRLHVAQQPLRRVALEHMVAVRVRPLQRLYEGHRCPKPRCLNLSGERIKTWYGPWCGPIAIGRAGFIVARATLLYDPNPIFHRSSSSAYQKKKIVKR